MDLAACLAHQDGLIARRQALASGMTSTHIKRRVRRREWVTIHPGVYADHTGELTWQQRAWAAVLATGPKAALCLDSALRAHEGAGRRESADSVIHWRMRAGAVVRPPRACATDSTNGTGSPSATGSAQF